MAAELWSSNENSSSSSSNSTQSLDFDYYNWCTDYPNSPVIWSTLSMLCFLVGFPANVWVLHELVKRQRQRSNSEIFVLSLAVVDLTFTALIPFCVGNFRIWHCLALQNSLFLMYSLSIIGRPLFMACICWDCYMAVVYPIVYKTNPKLIVAKKAIAVTIFFVTIIGGLLSFVKPVPSSSPLQAIPLIVALPVTCFCDISIFRSLRKPDPTGNNNIHPQKKQAVYTITSSFILTFIVYLPPMMIFLFGILLNLRDVDYVCGLSAYAICFFTVGCVIMPVLYLIRIGKLDVFKNCWERNST